MQTIYWTCALAVGLSVAWSAPAWATLDHDGTVWMYEADGSDFAGNGSLPGNNETIDVDGTRINGWDYRTSSTAGIGTNGWDVNDPDDRWNRDTFGFTASDPVMPMPGVITYDLNEDGRGGFARDQTLGSMNPGDITPNTGFTYEWRMATHWAGNDTTEKIFIQVDTGVLFDRAFSFRLNWSDQPSFLVPDTTQIVDVWGGKGIKAATNLIDPDADGNPGPSVFHTYRLVLEAMGLDGADDPTEASADLYIDEAFVDTVFGRLFVDGGFPGSNIENVNDPRPVRESPSDAGRAVAITDFRVPPGTLCASTRAARHHQPVCRAISTATATATTSTSTSWLARSAMAPAMQSSTSTGRAMPTSPTMRILISTSLTIPC